MKPWRPGVDRRAVHHPAPAPSTTAAAARPLDRVAVVGGGIAGLAAATALAERGVGVTLYEREPQLGGRVASWPVDVPDGPEATMSRGFHAFFRQYYTLRALLRRTDPALSHLRALDDYPLVHADGDTDTFTGLPTRPPWSVAAFAARSRSFPLRDLAKVDVREAMRLLTVDFPASFSAYDGLSAADVLDGLRFPPRARSLSLEVFARSFFADPREFAAGELVAMFHAYFMGSAEGLIFDVPDGDYDRVLWAPLGRYLTGLGARVRVGTTVTGLESPAGGGVRVHAASAGTADTDEGGESAEDVDAVVLATDLAPLQRLVGEAPWLGDPRWRERVAALRRAPEFVVWRQWWDRPVAPGTAPFVGTAAYGALDNVSVVDAFEAEAAAWARRTGGSVVELHAYAVAPGTPDDAVRADLRTQLLRLHPELTQATPVAERWLRRGDCPLVTPDPWAERPGVVTPDPRVVLAGDLVRCPWPVALMERAAVTGFQAANELLRAAGRPGHDLWSVPLTGTLATSRWSRGRARTPARSPSS